MKQVKTNMLIYTLVLGLIMGNLIYAQDKIAPEPKVYYSHSTTGDVSNPMLSLTPPAPVQKSQAQQDLENRLDIARRSNDVTLARSLQAQLDNLLGHVQVYEPSDPRMHFVWNTKNQQPQGDYMLAQIHNLSIFSGAVATVPTGMPTAGTIWYVCTQFAGSAADTVKFYKSTNNGGSWGYAGAMWFSFNHDFISDEMDIEVVNDGTTVWLFGVSGLIDYTDNNRKKCLFWRVPISVGGGAYGTFLNFPGISATGNNYYNPRIVSDNSNYTTNSYVMVLCSVDSLSGSSHTLMQKYALSTSPFASTPTLDYTQPSGNKFFWSCNCGTSSNLYLYGDIGYYRDDAGTGSNRVYAVYGNSLGGFTNIYIAYLQGYNTVGGSLSIAETNFNTNVKVNFNGGANNRYGMISYVRQYSASDWDPYYYATSNGGSTTGDWTAGFIDPSNNRARTCDVIAVRGASNQFRCCYAQDNTSAPSCFYTSWSGTWSTINVINNLALDTTYGKPRAGYVNGGGDDCLGIWTGGPIGVNAYSSRLCATTVGIHKTGIPVEFSLSQNYPNPFNPSTLIKYEIPVGSNVSVTVYNLLGESVATLVNEYKTAGSYEIKFDASNYASGVYFYKIEAGAFSDIKKMMLVK